MKVRGTRRCVLVGVAVVMALAMSALGTLPAGAASAKPKSGGALVFAMNSEPGNLDTATTGGAGGSYANTIGPYMAAIYDSLVFINPVTQKLTPGLALSWTPSQSNLVWTVKLRPNVTFSDGTPFDANAIKALLDRIADPATGSSTRTTLSGWTWAVKDPQTFVVTLPTALGDFAQLLTATLGSIPSPTAVTKYGKTYGSSPSTTVGAGPFIPSEWVRNDHMTLKKNPNYYVKGRPYLDTLTLKTLADASLKADALRTGTVDLGYYSQSDLNVQSLLQQGMQALSFTSPGAYGASFNVSKAPFDDLRVRQAFVLATNALDSNAKATGNASPVASNKKGVAFYPNSSPFYDPKVTQPDYNLAQAQKLIDSYVAEKGPINATDLVAATGTLPTLATAMVQTWNQLKNVNVAVNAQTPTQTIALLAAGNYQLTSSLVNGYTYPDQAYLVFYSTSSANIIKYNNPAMDQLLTQYRGAATIADRKEGLSKITALQEKDALFTRVFFAQYTVFGTKKVGGLKEMTGSVSWPVLTSLWVKNA